MTGKAKKRVVRIEFKDTSPPTQTVGSCTRNPGNRAGASSITYLSTQHMQASLISAIELVSLFPIGMPHVTHFSTARRAMQKVSHHWLCYLKHSLPPPSLHPSSTLPAPSLHPPFTLPAPSLHLPCSLHPPSTLPPSTLLPLVA